MGFSTEWETIYANQKQLSIWPWSELVSLVKKHTKLDASHKVIELGVGAGANIPFFLNQQVDFYGIDGSQSIISQLQERFPELAANLCAADFVKEIPFNQTFDLIVDRGSMTCNSTAAIETCISLIHKHLKPGGIFIGVDWISRHHTGYQTGRAVDEYTECDFPEGFFHQLGQIHFSDDKHIQALFHQFEFLQLDHKMIQQILPNPNFCMARYNFVVRKPA